MNDEVKPDETENFVVTTSDAPVVETKEEKTPEVKTEEKKAPEPKKEPEAKPEGKEEVKKEETTSTDDAASGDATAEQTKKKGGVQKRVDKLVREREDEKRKNESLEKQNNELQKRLDAKKEPEKTSKEPKEGDFDTYDEYLDAMDKHEKDLSGTEKKPEAQKEPEKAPTDTEENQLSDAQRTALAVIQEKVQDAAEKFSDFDDVALAKDVDITGDMLEALAECEDPAKVMYHLGKNKSLATEIAAMKPAQQMREITRLDISEKVVPEKPSQKTKASEPITPVGGSDSQEKDVENMSFKEYEETMNKKEQDRGASW